MFDFRCLNSLAAKIVPILLTAILLPFAVPREIRAAQQPLPPQISAPSAALMDAADGRVLWGKNSHERRPIASTTKIMTAILALENLKQNELVVTSPRASSAGESELYLTPGEQLKVKDLLYALLLRSANDAAVVLAEKVAGSVETFAKLMTEKAQSLGALDTNFTNPHGLKNGNHFSTAYDLALITRYALRNKQFAQIIKTKTYVIPWPGNPYPRVCSNHNRLLEMYPWATGVKTGYTKEAGYCLVGSARKNSMELIAVVLGGSSANTTFEETKAILEYGFANFEKRRLVEKGRSYGSLSLPGNPAKVKLIAASNFVATVGRNGYPSALEKSVVIKSHPSLPVRKGQVLGRIRYRQGPWVLGEVNLKADRSIYRPSLFSKAKTLLLSLFGGFAKAQ